MIINDNNNIIIIMLINYINKITCFCSKLNKLITTTKLNCLINTIIINNNNHLFTNNLYN